MAWNPFGIPRQDTEFRLRQELKLQKLIPTTAGPALSPTFTAYEPTQRLFFTTVRRNSTSGSLWGLTLANDVNNASWYTQEVRFAFPVVDAVMVGLQAFSESSGSVTVVVLFEGGQVVQVDPRTGVTRDVAMLGNNSRSLTTATTVDPATGSLFVVTEASEELPQRQVVTLSMVSWQVTARAALQPLKQHDPAVEKPFEMRFIAHLQTLLLFFTGNFDQIVYLEPHSGMTTMAVGDLASFT